MDLRLQLVTGPTGYPLEAADLEAHSRAMGQPLEQLEPYLFAATDHIETITNRRCLTQTWKMFLDCFPGSGVIHLPYSPLVSVAHVKYTDSTGTQRTFAATEYGVSTARTPGAIVLEYQKDWPTDTLRNTDPVEVQFTCGYGLPTQVPHQLRQAIRMLAAHFYEHREAVIIGTTSAIDEKELPFAVSALIAPFRVWL
jgi:uncharacterized phiE125 gp8 family phage protein